jgi:hypothetical protein
MGLLNQTRLFQFTHYVPDGGRTPTCPSGKPIGQNERTHGLTRDQVLLYNGGEHGLSPSVKQFLLSCLGG